MKKMMAVAALTVVMLACSQNENKEQSTGSNESNSPVSTSTEAEKRAKEIADSTEMLDKKLADPNDPTTPDS